MPSAKRQARPPAYIIRAARDEDHEALCSLFAEVDRFHQTAEPHIYAGPPDPPRAREFISHLIDDELHGLFVAEQAGDIVGLIQVEERSTPNNPVLVPRSYLFVDTLDVAERARGSGVGRALMERAHAWGKQRGLETAELSVRGSNAGAIRFYGQLGYTTLNHVMSRRLPP